MLVGLGGGAEGGDARHGCVGAGHGGDQGDVVDGGQGADLALVGGGSATRWGVDQQVDLAVGDHVGDVGPALGQLGHQLNADAGAAEKLVRAAGGHQAEAHGRELLAEAHDLGLVVVADAQEHRALGRQLHSSGHLALGERHAEAHVDAHHLAGRPHLRPEYHVHARELGEREDALFYRGLPRARRLGHAKLIHAQPSHDLGGELRPRHAGRLGDERHGSAGARIHLDDEHLAVLDGELDVHEPANAQPLSQQVGLTLDLADDLGRQAERRQGAGRIARVNARLLDVLHHAADHGPWILLSRAVRARAEVGDAIDVHLDGVVQELVDQDRVVPPHRRGIHSFCHVGVELLLVRDDLHRPPAKNVAGPHQHRIADPLGHLAGLLDRKRRTAGRALQLELIEYLGEPLAVLRKVDRLRAGADDRHLVLFQTAGEVQRGLAAELDYHAVQKTAGLAQRLAVEPLADVQHVLLRQRLEKQHVGRVVVRRDGLRVRVDHHRLVPKLAGREGRVNATVVELDPLPDPVRPAAENDDLLAVRDANLIINRLRIACHGGAFGGAGRIACLRTRVENGDGLRGCFAVPAPFFDDATIFPQFHASDRRLVRRVVVRRISFELGRAGVHQLVDGLDACKNAHAADLPRLSAPDRCQLDVAVAPLFRLFQQVEDPNLQLAVLGNLRVEPVELRVFEHVDGLVGQLGRLLIIAGIMESLGLQHLLGALGHNPVRLGSKLYDLPGGRGLLHQRRQLILELDELADVFEEPAVDLAEFEDLIDAPAELEGVADVIQPALAGDGQLAGKLRIIDGPFNVGPGRALGHGNLCGLRLRQYAPRLRSGQSARLRQRLRRGMQSAIPRVEPLVAAVQAQAETLDLHRANALLEAFLERPADAHGLADGLHLRGERLVGLRELLERPTRNLRHHVVDRRLETGGRLAGDVVAELVERVAHGQLRGDLGDGEAGGLGRQGRRPADAGVHLDDDHPAGDGIDGELDVAAPGLDADSANNRDRGVPHELVFLVRKRLGRGDGDRVARVDAHRVEVLDRADDDHVVRLVAHDLQLVLLPAEQGFLDQDLADRRILQTAGGDSLELLAVEGEPPAGAAQRVGRADAHGQAHLVGDPPRLAHVVRNAALRHVQADAKADVLELGAVLGPVDDLPSRADHLDAELGQRAVVRHGHGRVQARLPAERRQQGVGTFLFDDLRDGVGGYRLDIRAVGELRIGHDGRRVGVDQDDSIPLLAQGLAGLRAGIIELAALADNDRTGPDEHDGLQVIPSWHIPWLPLVAIRYSPARRAAQPVRHGQIRKKLPKPPSRHKGQKNGRRGTESNKKQKKQQ